MDSSNMYFGYNAGIGTIEEINSHISKDKIKAYIKELFVITKEDRDNHFDVHSSKIVNSLE
jgi:hypothetical protein